MVSEKLSGDEVGVQQRYWGRDDQSARINGEYKKILSIIRFN